MSSGSVATSPKSNLNSVPLRNIDILAAAPSKVTPTKVPKSAIGMRVSGSHKNITIGTVIPKTRNGLNNVIGPGHLTTKLRDN